MLTFFIILRLKIKLIYFNNILDMVLLPQIADQNRQKQRHETTTHRVTKTVTKGTRRIMETITRGPLQNTINPIIPL